MNCARCLWPSLRPRTVVNLAPTRQRLENDVFTVSGIAQKYNCALRRLDWQQEQGFVSSLALGYNGIEIQRGMTTSSTAIFIPFMTRELRMDGQALYYGMNALSNNVIISNMGAYMRKMALNGYVLHVDLSDIRELVALQRRCANNLNQVAIHANTYGIYPSEIAALQKDYADLWEPLSELLKKLSAVVSL